MNVYRKEVTLHTVKLIEKYFHKEKKVFDYNLVVKTVLLKSSGVYNFTDFRNLVFLTLKVLAKISGIDYKYFIPKREFVFMVKDNAIDNNRLLTEGLIMTHNIDRSINIIKRKYKEARVEKITESDFNVFIKNQFDSFNVISLARNLGYICTYWETGEKSGKKTSDLHSFVYDEITLFFEAKYDIDNEDVKILYHITPLINWNKIKKIGLAPKSRSKRSYHPKRIYLSKTLKNLDKLAELMYNDSLDKELYKKWAVLKIVIPEDKEIVLNKDVNFVGGVYTLNNIHPDWVEKIKEIEF